MKIMRILRYPILFLAVILLPASLATAFIDLPDILQQRGWLSNPGRWYTFSALAGYVFGYLLISESLQWINRLFDAPIYPKRIRTTYLMTNAIVALLSLGVLGYGVSVLYTSQPLTITSAIIFIGLPWVGLQMLLLLFFVRSDSF